MIKRILVKILLPLVKWVKIADIDRNLRSIKHLAEQYEAKLEKIPEVYTTIRSFAEDPDSYWQWAKAFSNSDQFRFLIFQLRENVIREMSICKDEKDYLNNIGRMQMLNIMANYLKTGIEEYEASLRRASENSEGN